MPLPGTNLTKGLLRSSDFKKVLAIPCDKAKVSGSRQTDGWGERTGGVGEVLQLVEKESFSHCPQVLRPGS